MADSVADHVEGLNLDEVVIGDPSGAEDQGPDSQQGSDNNDAERDNAGGKDKGETGSDTSGDSEGAGTDEGYIADEVEGEDEPEPAPVAPSPQSPELAYIVDNLPTLSVRGKESETGRVKVYNVKAPGQLPDDFIFASDKERAVFGQAVAAQENLATKLQNDFRANAQQLTNKQYADRENADIRSDLSDLQREGLMPKYKYPPNDRRFESDPAVKESQKVLDYMNETNNMYAKSNKLYRISYRTAYELLERQNQSATRNNPQSQEDRARRTVTRQMAGATSTSSSSPAKARPARSMEELKARIDSYDF